MITIITKVDNPKSFAKFHPIALCNILYKIFTKAISYILLRVIPKIISNEQGAFVPRKETLDGAIVAHEVLHSISSRKIPLMILKLDMMI